MSPTLPGDTEQNDAVSCDAQVAEQEKMENTFQLAVENQVPSKINQMPIKNKTKTKKYEINPGMIHVCRSNGKKAQNFYFKHSNQNF